MKNLSCFVNFEVELKKQVEVVLGWDMFFFSFNVVIYKQTSLPFLNCIQHFVIIHIAMAVFHVKNWYIICFVDDFVNILPVSDFEFLTVEINGVEHQIRKDGYDVLFLLAVSSVIIQVYFQRA